MLLRLELFFHCASCKRLLLLPRSEHQRTQGVLPRAAVAVRGGGRHAREAPVLQGRGAGSSTSLGTARARRLPLHPGQELPREDLPGALQVAGEERPRPATGDDFVAYSSPIVKIKNDISSLPRI